MENNFDKILDECIDRINRGESLESCLADYPEYGERLEPLLQAMLQTKETYSFAPSASIKREARQRFNTALEELERKREERQPLFSWLPGWSRVWATAAVVILIALAGYFGLRPVLFPGEVTPQPGPLIVAPSPPKMGTVEVRVTDGPPGYEVQEVEMSVESVEVHMADGKGWDELQMLEDVNPIMLTDLTGGIFQTLAKEPVEAGMYTQIRLGIEWVEISYTKDSEPQEPVRTTLSSDKLKFVRPFNVEEEEITVITFDFIVDESVVFTGAQASEAPKVIFKPVIKLDIQQGGQAEETEEVDGEITGVEVVDDNEGTVSILPISDPEVTLNVNGDTEITLNGDAKTLSELETAFLALEEGEVISASAEYDTQNMNATLIEASLSSP